MYCSTCGVAVAQGLSYCNHCGAKLNTSESVEKPAPRAPLDFLIFSMVATFILGTAVVTMLMGVMKVILGLSVESVLVFGSVPFLLMLMLEAVFIRLLLRNRTTSETNQKTLAKEQETNELDAAHPLALREPMPSVSEHTTRAFEPIYRDRSAK